MPGMHIRYNETLKQYEYTHSGTDTGPWVKLDLTTHAPPATSLPPTIAYTDVSNTFAPVQKFNNEIVTNLIDAIIRPDTVDGADVKSVIICGGGGAASTRGPYIWLRGNEYSSDPGNITLATPKVFVAGDIHEKDRTTAIGHWIDVVYSAANFTASAGTWTVEVGDQLSYTYTVIGKTVIVVFYIQTSGVSVAASLRLKIPGGFVAAKYARTTIQAFDVGTPKVGMAYVSPGDTNISFGSDIAASNFGVSTNNTYVIGQIVIPIQ